MDRRPRTQADASEVENHLSFVLRQAAIRCVERHKQRRPKPFDRLLLTFAHYFADPRDMPFVKILRDAPRNVVPRPKYEDPHEYIKDLLEHENATSVEDGNAGNVDEAVISQCLDEARVVADAVDIDQENSKRKLQLERERRSLQAKAASTNSNNNNRKNKTSNRDYHNDAFDELEDDEDNTGAMNGDDDGFAEYDALLRQQERALQLSSYFRICYALLDAGVAAGFALRGLDPDIADEAADLVACAGPQLPKAIATTEALSRSDAEGIDPVFYGAVSKIAKLILARQHSVEFVERFCKDLDVVEREDAIIVQLQEQQQQMFANLTNNSSNNQNNANNNSGGGQPPRDPNALQTFEEVQQIMQRAGEQLDADEFAFNDEVQLASSTTATNQQQQQRRPQQQQQTQLQRMLTKPERFAKVITGYGWSNYNKAHYSFEKPPPKTVQAYEFTLFYPDLPDFRKAPRFEVLPTDKGWDDEYCYIEFDAGPPYAKVAYRIVNRRWDKRKTKATFDASGRFKLFFKFESASYKR